MDNHSGEIKLDGAFENFYEHFNKPGNSRILFTAPFGMGKTYFLNRFFNVYMEGKDQDVQWIRVSPVNYVPSDNVTIFELIKVEILLNLFLCGELDSDKIDLKSTYFESSLEFVKRKPGALVNLIADMLPLLSIDPVTNLALSGIKDSAKSVTGFLGEIKKLKVENEQSQLSDDTTAKDYIEHLINQKGTHLEFDLISEIIYRTIEKSEKKFVLVVDDLDRLDPAHIFRILNIFSAHNNFEEKNKFGFDKVITVCDLGNIEKIFHHFYGEKTDFRGYIDKFVTFNPYKYENFENILNFIKENNKIEILKDFNVVLSLLVYSGITKNLTNLRSLVSALEFENNENGFFQIHDYRIDKSTLAFIYFTKFIKQLHSISYFNSNDLKFLLSRRPDFNVLNEVELMKFRDQSFKLMGFIFFKDSDFYSPTRRFANTISAKLDQSFVINFSYKTEIKDGYTYLKDYELSEVLSGDGSRLYDSRSKEFVSSLLGRLLIEIDKKTFTN